MKQPGSLQKIEDTTLYSNSHSQMNFYNWVNCEWYHNLIYGIIMLSMFPMIIQELSWHHGASVLANTLKHAFNDLMDILVVIVMLLCGLGAVANTWFGAVGGSRDFHNFVMAANTIARLSFGLYDLILYIGWIGVGI